MADEALLKELRDVRPSLFRLDEILVTPKAAKVMELAKVEPASLVKRYDEDVAGHEPGLIGYRLIEVGPASETCVHVAFDPELSEVVIYEEW